MQVLDLIEATEGDGYAISGDSIHGNSSSLGDACSRPRWLLNDISLNSSSNVPFDDKTSSGLGHRFENLISY
jgi:hypothetical protein